MQKTVSQNRSEGGAESNVKGSPALRPPIRNLLRFDGQWRSYQKRVLDRADNYLKDKRIHIVAAPGSGKTTLGIELIRRLNAPALILSPSINIRNQWLKRIEEAFLPEHTDTTGILSDSIRKPALITAITYQALHSCMTGKGKNSGQKTAETDAQEPDSLTNREAIEEREDYGSFDFFQEVKASNIKTLCLDEAHHLRSEWWKALEELVKKEPDMTIISLTATPPYDSVKSEWERYISLCGPIDEEIIVPELVKEGSLCPHQDYVYFNMPTEEEARAVTGFRRDAAQVGEQIFMDERFARMVSTHAGIRNPEGYAEQLLEKPAYLSSLLVFLNAKKIPFSKDLLHMMGAGENIPSMSLKWLEILLQGFLYDDVDSFAPDAAYREEMISLLKGHGLIRKNKVGFTVNEEVNKLLTMSKGKIRSIVTIVGEEYRNLGGRLRMLILTDYIKKEYLSALGNTDKSVNELGVVPIFENIRREYETVRGREATDKEPVGKEATDKEPTDRDLRLAALSGSVVLIPESAKADLESIMADKGVKGSIKECGAAGYYQVAVSGSEETASGLVTELFYRGSIRVLVGTKSLLGEGWDSPCINSLILASFVGSFMLSNQMRGRAIRTMKGNPDKVSNIWHLICMEPEGNSSEKRALKSPEESEDFATLKRRFEGFLGVHYEENVIENGLSRLSFIKPPYTGAMLEKINQQMLAMAAGRTALKKRWEDSLVELKEMDVAVEAGADKAFFKPGAALFNACAGLLLWIAAAGICMVNFAVPVIWGLAAGKPLGLLLTGGLLLTVLSLIPVFRYGGRVAGMATPFRFMQSIGNGILRALQRTGNIVSGKVRVNVDREKGLVSYIYLSGGTEREKDVFAQCVTEMFGVVDNQRYLLKAKTHVPKLCKYYCVPELFGKKKEDAQLFTESMARYIGPYELIYTRSGEGRKVLLEARIHSFSNKNERCVDKRKKVKSAWE